MSRLLPSCICIGVDRGSLGLALRCDCLQLISMAVTLAVIKEVRVPLFVFDQSGSWPEVKSALTSYWFDDLVSMFALNPYPAFVRT